MSELINTADEYRDPAHGHDHATTEWCQQSCPAWDRVQFVKSVEQTLHDITHTPTEPTTQEDGL